MAKKILSAGLWGLEGQLIEVEADLGGGEIGVFLIVGLPDKAVSESRERVRSAIKSLGIKFPQRKVVVNLAPADFKKQGPSYDLAIAVSVLSLLYDFKEDFKKAAFLGELALNGDLRPVNGVLSIASYLKEMGVEKIYLPQDNLKEAQLVSGLKAFPLKNLRELFLHLINKEEIIIKNNKEKFIPEEQGLFLLENINGQKQAKRALEISASGGHNLLMFGSPGAGKTILAKSLNSILPDLDINEAIEVTKIYSLAGKLKGRGLIRARPFRSPHHNSSPSAILGGGSWPQPGEISLAHRGVLFLDELGEFSTFVLNSLRQPMEDGCINVSRVSQSLSFPARFMLIGAMNPCPCGYLGDKNKECLCSSAQLNSYGKKISGPIKDRIDMFIEVPRLEFKNLIQEKKEESSAEVKKRVQVAREIQLKRFRGMKIFCNSEMSSEMVKKVCKTDEPSKQLLKKAMDKFNLSARSYFRVLKIARTIADLSNRPEINFSDLAEALQYRPPRE